jgi:hypothetical protein
MERSRDSAQNRRPFHHAAFSTPEAADAGGGSSRRNDMSDYTTKDRNRKLMMLGGLGLGLAMLGRKRRWRRYAMSQMMGGGNAGGPWGRFGGYSHGGPGGPQQTFTLPPFIEATLKAWHDRAHGTVPPAAMSQPGTAQV